MISPISVDYPTLSNWQDLERLSVDLFTEIHDQIFQRWGRTGQQQDGIDAWALLPNGKAIVLQCKGKSQSLGKPLTTADIDAALRALGNFQFPIEQLFLLTTAPDDVGVQRYAAQLSAMRTHGGEYPISVWGWGTISHHIGQYERIQRTYFGHWFTRVSVRRWVGLGAALAIIGTMSVIGGMRFLGGQEAADQRREVSVKELQHFVTLTDNLSSAYAHCEDLLIKRMFAFQAEFRHACTAPILERLNSIKAHIQNVTPSLASQAWDEIHQLSDLMTEDYRQAEIAAFMTRGFEEEVIHIFFDICHKNQSKSHNIEREKAAYRAARISMTSQLQYYFVLRDFILPGLDAMKARVLIHARDLAGESVPEALVARANRLTTISEERRAYSFKEPREPFTISAVKVMSSRNITTSTEGVENLAEKARWAEIYTLAPSKVFYGRSNEVEALISCGVFRPHARKLIDRL